MSLSRFDFFYIVDNHEIKFCDYSTFDLTYALYDRIGMTRKYFPFHTLEYSMKV